MTDRVNWQINNVFGWRNPRLLLGALAEMFGMHAAAVYRGIQQYIRSELRPNVYQERRLVPVGDWLQTARLMVEYANGTIDAAEAARRCPPAIRRVDDGGWEVNYARRLQGLLSGSEITESSGLLRWPEEGEYYVVGYLPWAFRDALPSDVDPEEGRERVDAARAIAIASHTGPRYERTGAKYSLPRQSRALIESVLAGVP